MADEIIKDKTVALTIGVFILLSALGTVYFIGEGDNAYACNATGEEIVGLCFKLSAVNDEGTQTRCYYNESAPRTYKVCSTGWYEYEGKEIIGNETILPDAIERYKIESDFNSKLSAEEYIIDLKKDIGYKYQIVNKISRPFSSELEIQWFITLFKDDKILYEELLSSKVPENFSSEQIEERIDLHSFEFVKNYKPNILVVIP